MYLSPLSQKKVFKTANPYGKYLGGGGVASMYVFRLKSVLSSVKCKQRFVFIYLKLRFCYGPRLPD